MSSPKCKISSLQARAGGWLGDISNLKFEIRPKSVVVDSRLSEAPRSPVPDPPPLSRLCSRPSAFAKGAIVYVGMPVKFGVCAGRGKGQTQAVNHTWNFSNFL